MVGARDRRERRQERRTREDALGVVRVQPDLLPLICGQRPRLQPDPRVDRDAPEVVDERGAPDRGDARRIDAATLRRRARQLRHPGRVTGQIRRDQVREVADRGQRPIDRPALQREMRVRLAGQRPLPGRCLGAEREDLVGTVCEAGGDLGIEGVPGAFADHPHGEGLAAEHALDGSVASDVHDPDREGDLVPLGPPERALAVPALGQVREQVPHRCSETEPLGEHLRHLAHRGQVWIPLPPRPRQATRDLDRTRGRRAPRRRKRAQEPSERLALRPERHRDEARLRAAEGLRRHLDVDVAARVHQQAGVVRLRRRRAVDPEAIAEAHRDEGAVQAVLERERHREIGAEAQRRDDLRGTNPFTRRQCLRRHGTTLAWACRPGRDPLGARVRVDRYPASALSSAGATCFLRLITPGRAATPSSHASP